MNGPSKHFLATLKRDSRQGALLDRPPFWFMRQAGRYLPEYKELRKKAKHFLHFCYSPDMASEATLQPITRFHMDAAIIFSDILVVPDAMGMDVRFEEGKGPILVPVQNEKELAALKVEHLTEKLLPVYEALKLTRKKLPNDVALIGFAGAPWTLACYMIEGKGSRDFQGPRCKMYQEPVFFKKLIDMLVSGISAHCIEQIKAGAEAIQIFDSWSGVLSEQQFMDWSIIPTKKIVENIKAAYPDIPVIGFPRMAGSKVFDYVQHTGVDAVSIDGSITLDWAKRALSPHVTVQGNLDPIVLVGDKDRMLSEAKRLLETFSNTPFVFNLGHGILPTTPIPHVEALCNLIRQPV